MKDSKHQTSSVFPHQDALTTWCSIRMCVCKCVLQEPIIRMATVLGYALQQQNILILDAMNNVVL